MKSAGSASESEGAEAANDGWFAGKSEVLAGVGSWMVCSVGMLVFNKLAIHSFMVPCTLVALQFLFTAVAIVAVSYNTLHIGSWQDALRWSRVVPFFTGMILTSILALWKAPMSLVITLRAMSPVLSLAVERFYPNPLRLTGLVVLTLAGGILGMAIYIAGMSWDNLSGVGWAVLNNFLAVGDRLLQRLMLAKDQEPVDISKTAATVLSNSLGLIPLAVTALIIGEFRQVPGAVEQLDALKIVWIFLSCVVGAGISYTGVWAQSLITATSFLVLVNANKFFIIFLEAAFMSKSLTWLQILGAIISILSGIAYGKAREMAEAEEKAAQDETSQRHLMAGEESAKTVEEEEGGRQGA